MAAPKLRFKEFDGDWSQSKIGEIFQVTSGSTPLRSDNRFFENADIAWVKTTDLNNGLIEKTEEKISQIALKETSVKILPKGTVFVAMYGGFNQIGRTGLLVHEAACNQALSAIYPNEKIDSYFLLTFLNHKVDDWKNFAASSRKDPNITKSDVLAFPLKYPVKEEQTKIASFLSAVDEKISQLTQKHELLSQYKQGMMQKLFSQQLRFKADDGSEFGEWEEVKFSGIFNFHQTNSYSRALLAEYGEIMNIHYGDIHTKFSMLFDVNKESVPFLNDEVDTSKIAKEQFLKVGDLVIADASEDYKDIGKSIEVISLNNQKVVAGLHTYIARPVKPFALGFCGYMMQTFPVREQIKKLATGISVLGISKTNLGKVELKVPSLEEQTKIANFLSAIDQKIEVVVQQIEQAKTWKKGLLQQMFV